MKKILVPTDFSEQAQNAFDLAVQIAKTVNGEVFLLHVADLPVVSDPMGTNLHAFLSPETIKSLEEKVDSKFNDFETAYGRGVKVHRIMEWGNPFSGITNNILSTKCDLVVMGSKGVSGFREIFVGSNTERIIRFSRVPVITIKSKVNIDDIRSLVFGLNVMEDDKLLFDRVSELASFLGAKLHMVYINTPTNFKRDIEVIPKLKKLSDKYFPKGTEVHVFNDLNEDLGLIHFAERVSADMIALGTHGKRGFEHFISGSIAEDIANHAKRPIWTFITEK